MHRSAAHLPSSSGKALGPAIVASALNPTHRSVSVIGPNVAPSKLAPHLLLSARYPSVYRISSSYVAAISVPVQYDG